MAAILAIGNPVALDASAELRDTLAYINLDLEDPPLQFALPEEDKREELAQALVRDLAKELGVKETTLSDLSDKANNINTAEADLDNLRIITFVISGFTILSAIALRVRYRLPDFI